MGGDVFISGHSADSSSVNHWITRKTTNNGGTWTTVDNFNLTSGYSSQAAAFGQDSNGILYSVGWGNDNTGVQHWIVRKSQDSGTTWSTVDDFQFTSGRNSQASGFTKDGSGKIYVSGYGQDSSGFNHWIVRMSSDGGATWALVDDYQQTTNQNSSALSIAINSLGNLFTTGFGFNGTANFWITRKY